MTTVVLALGGLIFLAHLFAIVFQRTKIPDVLLLMLIGLLIGPVFGIVNEADLGRVGQALSGVALVVILFESGTTIDVSILGKSLRATLRLTLLTFLATLILFAGTAFLALRLTPTAALLLGAILAGTSSAVVIPLVRGLGLGEKAGTVLVLESALTDVLCIVSVFALLAAAQQGRVDPMRLLGGVAASLLLAAVFGIVCGILWMRALPLVRRLPNTIIATVAFVCVVYGATEMMGFSGAIASLTFGITLTNHERMGFVERLARPRGAEVPTTLQPVEQQFFSEVVFVLKTLFFVYLGQSIRFGETSIIAFAVSATLLVYFVRPYVAAWTVDRDYSLREASVTAVMVPKGLAAAVLAGLPMQQGIPGGPVIRDVSYAVVLVSIVLTAVLAFLQDRRPLRGYFERVFRRLPAIAGGKPPLAVAGAPHAVGEVITPRAPAALPSGESVKPAAAPVEPAAPVESADRPPPAADSPAAPAPAPTPPPPAPRPSQAPAPPAVPPRPPAPPTPAAPPPPTPVAPPPPTPAAPPPPTPAAPPPPTAAPAPPPPPPASPPPAPPPSPGTPGAPPKPEGDGQGA